MKVTPTEFQGLFVVEPTVFEDHRGYFMESYNQKKLLEYGIDFNFVQDNQSKSSYGVLRGLHFQNPPHAQTKLVRALQGRIIDAVVDIRKSSPTYGKSFSIELSDENKRQIIVPKGFAHGFSVLSDTAEILYKCDAFYNKESEGGLMYNDSAFNIDWGLADNELILSEKDQGYQPFSKFKTQFQ
ncbi:MAG: dTDP-4-dehydrorhamnose 3,5-epimerase [Fulvivirga sp.]|uniref:dTDP-4-dehydrorhamnose 3,5-epimerase n=1 Tax=Fulvivirga sp. TaxID=1931237 RepID=UPI0032EE4669